MGPTLYLKSTPEDVSESVLLTGSPERVMRIADMLEETQIISRSREYITVTGHYQGERITAVSSGIGAPSAAIAIEELVKLGVKRIVRVGTTMGVGAPLGACVIATGAARFEGTSRSYLDAAFPAVPDWELAQAILDSCSKTELDVYLGITATYDAFYPSMAPGLIGRESTNYEELQRAQVMAIDMETALLYIMGLRLRFAAVSICLVTNQFEPFAVIDPQARRDSEEKLVKTVLDSLALSEPR